MFQSFNLTARFGELLQLRNSAQKSKNNTGNLAKAINMNEIPIVKRNNSITHSNLIGIESRNSRMDEDKKGYRIQMKFTVYKLTSSIILGKN